MNPVSSSCLRTKSDECTVGLQSRPAALGIGHCQQKARARREDLEYERAVGARRRFKEALEGLPSITLRRTSSKSGADHRSRTILGRARMGDSFDRDLCSGDRFSRFVDNHRGEGVGLRKLHLDSIAPLADFHPRRPDAGRKPLPVCDQVSEDRLFRQQPGETSLSRRYA